MPPAPTDAIGLVYRRYHGEGDARRSGCILYGVILHAGIVLERGSLAEESIAPLAQQQIQEWPNEIDGEPDDSDP
jgi:hypothetical protein